MGGPGSGNHYHWRRSGKKTVVEDCRVIDLGELARSGSFKQGTAGLLRWLRGGQEVSSLSYRVASSAARDGGLVLVLDYRISRTGEAVTIPIPLEVTRPHFGGLRWWGRCPLLVNGVGCGRRVAKLYCPPGARYYGCRHCHRLTYRSVQEHDKRVDFLRRHPGAIEAVLNTPGGASVTQLGLAMRALRPRRLRGI
jgi:hypothetical protein